MDYREVREYSESVRNAKRICELHTEMTDSQLGFLCGLIKESQPKKIVEVGVASGGTSLVIIQCLKELNLKSSFFSVDLNERLYSDSQKETGYIVKDAEKQKEYQITDHKYFLGHYLPEVLEEIGEGIDFLILDTVHHMPGELLDFLAGAPFLSDGAMVVLHDVALQHEPKTDNYCYATQVLFSCVTGTKYLNNNIKYPNIAAFQVGKETKNNLTDVFNALSLTWNYKPFLEEIQIYRLWYEKYFNDFNCRLFEQAVEMNYHTLSVTDPGFNDYMNTLCCSVLGMYEKVYLYGAGKRGKLFYKALSNLWDKNKVEKCKFLVSNEVDAKKNKCESWEMVKCVDNALIVLTADSSEIREKLRNSETHWIDIPSQIWKDMEKVYG